MELNEQRNPLTDPVAGDIIEGTEGRYVKGKTITVEVIEVFPANVGTILCKYSDVEYKVLHDIDVWLSSLGDLKVIKRGDE